MKKSLALATLVAVAAIVSACQATRSADPLSPTVAGPIPGVNITAPKLLEPTPGSQVANNTQPVTLLIENASSSGQRPLNYLFEVATDSGFSNKVFARDGVSPGDGGRTSLRLPDALATGRTYYWRSRAQDGANTGPYADATYFNVYTPIVIDKPVLVAPTNSAKVDANTASFTIGNAPRSGPVQAIRYTVELSDGDSFANKIAIWTIPEQANQTSFASPQGLPYSARLFWHARGYDANTVGPWSDTQTFLTSDAPPPPPPPPPTGGGGGGGGPIGDWRSCGSTPGLPLVQCVWNAVHPTNTPESVFEVTKRVAWLLRGQGAGLLIKNGGANIVSWNGYSFAAARILLPMAPTPHLWKLEMDVPNGPPTWNDEGLDSTLVGVAPMDPGP